MNATVVAVGANIIMNTTAVAIGTGKALSTNTADTIGAIGYSITAYNLGNIASFTVNAALGNYQYGSCNAAATWTAPSTDCAVNILITNGVSAGATTFSGFTVGASPGDALTTTSGNKFMVSIIRINSIATYVIKALQ
jgi:hypothetical protein